jgi:ComF family protein
MGPFAFSQRDVIDSILNILFPASCVVCGSRVLERRYGAACPDCWSNLVPVPQPICPACGDPAPAIEGLCGSCRIGEHAFDFARSAVLFTDTLREIIHHLKYSDRVSLANPLGDLLKACLEREAFSGGLIIPVPLHWSRVRIRGYNQAELIASRLERPFACDVLRRRKNTQSQTGLSRNQRKLNLTGAFEARRSISGGVIVVDDVYTTGATMNEIAKTLKRAGADRVEVLTVARVASFAYRADETGISVRESAVQ